MPKHIASFLFGLQVTQAIPDVHTTALHEMKYTGGGATKRAVQKAKDRLDRYHSFKYKLVAHGTVGTYLCTHIKSRDKVPNVKRETFAPYMRKEYGKVIRSV